MKRSKKAQSRARKIAALDAAARQEVFERDSNRCVRCGRVCVQWCHIISRRHLCTRWESDNALSMCAGCHMWWHSYPSLSGTWFARTWPERHEHITSLYNAGGKVRVEDLYEQLRQGAAL